MFPGLSVRRSGPAARQVSYAISLIPKVITVWLKWPISGKDLCTESEFQLLLYSTRAELPTLPIDGCHKGLTLHHPLKPCHSCNSGNNYNCQNNKTFLQCMDLRLLYYFTSTPCCCLFRVAKCYCC